MAHIETIWAFDLGKASIGEAVRQGNDFPHKASLLIPSELARRGPASASGTPANRYRAWRTRQAHKAREAWLDEVWTAAGLEVLRGRQVEYVGGWEVQKRKRVKGKIKLKKKIVGGQWMLAASGDPRLERELAPPGDDRTCYTSCLLRIKLLRGEKLEPWQIYKAFFSAIQSRGYGPVPWERQRKGQREATSADEEAAFAAAHRRWQDFLEELEKAKAKETFKLPCYFDAFHLKLWHPLQPNAALPTSANQNAQSTRRIVFPAEAVENEVLALAEKAAAAAPELKAAFSKVMHQYREGVKARIAALNALRAEKGKELLRLPPLTRGPKSFGELLAFGPGGRAPTLHGERPISSWNPELRRDMALHPGSPADHNAALGQKVARFDNRLRGDCALIGRLSVCRNLTVEELARIKQDDHERLLPAQVTFLKKLKDMWVEEKTPKRNQRGLKAEEIREMFDALNPKRKYHLTKTAWANWCERFDVVPVTRPNEKPKAASEAGMPDGDEKPEKPENAVEAPSVSGRCRYSRPALRILKELILSGLKPSELRARLVAREKELLDRLGMDILDTEPIRQEGKVKTFIKQQRPWLLVSDLDFLLKMRKDNATVDSWEGLFVPSRNLDRLAAEAEASPNADAIRALIGQQNNPIVRHRLALFWERLKLLENKFGVPDRIVIELVRDDPESSWLGEKAKEGIKKFQDENRERREKARELLKQLPQYKNTEPSPRTLLKFMLWQTQGGQCLYGRATADARCFYTETGLGIADLDAFRIDHIVPRALGGPDSFFNLILTDDDTNARKGDRTPHQWFQQDRTPEQWAAYRTRVLGRFRELGGKKVRLLLAADAHELVERYTPLAETAWIARLAQVLAGIHFGWANGIDTAGEKPTRRIVTVSGGLTGRVRRAYCLNSLTGPQSDQPLPDDLDDRQAFERAAEGERASKDRKDHRHHALDAMVLTFLEGWVNDPNREDEFRFTQLGDNACYLGKDMPIVNKRRLEIEQANQQVKAARTASERESLQVEITRRRDTLAQLRHKRDWRKVREFFQKEMEGKPESGILPVHPRYLHYPKPHLKAMRYRGVWLPVEKEARAARATIDDYDKAFEEVKMPLTRLAYLPSEDAEPKTFSVEHGLRQAPFLVKDRGFDAPAVQRAVEQFLRRLPSENQWQAFCGSDAFAALWEQKNETATDRLVVVYKLAAKRTKREKLFDLGMSNQEIPAFDPGHFEAQVQRLVIRPEKPKRNPRGPRTAGTSELPKLQTNTELAGKLRELRPSIEEHFRSNPPYVGERPRKESERAAWETKKKQNDAAWESFTKQAGLDRYKRVYLSTDAPDPSNPQWEAAGLKSVLLTRVQRFDPRKAEKQAQSISDAWVRFQVRELLKREPSQDAWRGFCESFVQVTRSRMKEFLETGQAGAAAFIAFFQQEREANHNAKHIGYVQQVAGDPDEYVDVSKDASGIYAKGGNSGYLMFKQVITLPEGTRKEAYGALPVRCFQKLHEARTSLEARPGVTLHDSELWRTNMLLHLPQETKSGKKTVPAGYYYLGSISNGAYATLKPLKGGDYFDGIAIDQLLAGGLRRVPEESI